MKISKIVILLSVALATLILVIALTVLISSKMQGYYKSQIDDSTIDTREVLNNKQFWVKVSEPKVLLPVSVISSLITTFITAIFLFRPTKKEFPPNKKESSFKQKKRI